MAHLSDLLSQKNLLTSKVGRDLDGILRQLFEDVGEAGEGAPTDATYVTNIPSASLDSEQALSLLSTGYAKVTTTTGEVSSVAAIPDADVAVDPTGLTNTDGTDLEEVISDFDAAITAASGSGGPPTGSAGGVLSGTYPNPGFAVDMATQAELDDHLNDAADAHDASAVSFDNTTAGLSATDAQAAIDELSDLIAGLSGQPADTRTGLVHGGQVVWETGLQFRVSHAIYYILGTLYESAEQTVTLAAADADNDRIDVIGLDTTQTVFDITGTAAVNPSEPSIDPETQLKLAVVIVPEDATAPGVTNTDIYLENTEWTTSVFDASINADSTNNPRTGSKCVEATTAAANDWVQFDSAVSVNLIGKQYLVLYLRSKAVWPSTKMLRARFQLAGVVKGVEVTIRDGYWGFDSSITASYQQVAIPLSQFQVPAGTLIDELRLSVVGSGGSIGFYIDDIFLQAGIEPISNLPHTHDAADIVSGVLAPARLGSGTADSQKFLRGDNSWQSATTYAQTLMDDTTAKAARNTLLFAKGADVASANNLAPGADGLVFHITGTTQINLIADTNFNAGDTIVLIFDGACLIKHNQTVSGANKPILLMGDVDWTTAANDVLALTYDGTSWYDIRRGLLSQIGIIPINAQSGTTYAPVIADRGKLITCTNASAITVTIPANASVAFPIGTVFQIYQGGVGQVTVAITSDTLRAPNGAKTAAQYSVISLTKLAATVWVLSGDSTT